jgi:beta-lactamase regulating signal transducer with metallopeptidase domain
MVNDLLSLIVRTNIALAVCVLFVLAVRSPTRRLVGARIAYALWLIPPLAALACLLPARTEFIRLPAMLLSARADALSVAPTPHQLMIDPRLVLALWIGGVVASFVVLILRQTRFARALGRLRCRDDLGAGVLVAESTEHGPAVLGVLRPVIVTPADFDARFSDEERRVVLAHERAHMAQGDPLINAILAALQCVNWFNPLVHMGARALRVDQELACDAAVLKTSSARLYAEAILKTQISAGAPLGCAWPSRSLASLKERIAMLKHNLPTRTQRLLGVSAIGLASFTACAVAWAAQPARVVITTPHASAAPATAATPLPPDPLTMPTAYAAPVASASETAAEAALAGPDQSNAADNDNADDASDDPDLADLADLDGGHDGVVVDDHGNVTSVRRLTPEQRAHIREAVRRAMEAQRTAMVQARAAMRDAQRQIEQAHIADAATADPQMRAEIAAITAEAMRMAQSATASEAQRQAMRADLQAHTQRLQEMAERLAAEAVAEAQAEIEREGPNQDSDNH